MQTLWRLLAIVAFAVLLDGLSNEPDGITPSGKFVCGRRVKWTVKVH